MFVLLKVLLLLLRPLVWIALVFIIALLTKNSRRKAMLFKTGCILLFFFSNPYIINRIMHSYETEPAQLPPTAHYSAGIVLGGFVAYNKEDNKGYFNDACDRFIQTALLYKKGYIDKIIIAAGNGYIVAHNFKEATFVKEALITLGIPGNAIYTDTSSRNTLENAVYTKAIIDAQHLQGPFLLISSAFHLPRAQRVFNKKNMAVVPYPCDFLARDISNNVIEDIFLPSAGALEAWDLFIKELAGIATYKLTGKG
jgi:uncharacterized SAM-binding protein YcdF (DUF218 family)